MGVDRSLSSGEFLYLHGATSKASGCPLSQSDAWGSEDETLGTAQRGRCAALNRSLHLSEPVFETTTPRKRPASSVARGYSRGLGLCSVHAVPRRKQQQEPERRPEQGAPHFPALRRRRAGGEGRAGIGPGPGSERLRPRCAAGGPLFTAPAPCARRHAPRSAPGQDGAAGTSPLPDPPRPRTRPARPAPAPPLDSSSPPTPPTPSRDPPPARMHPQTRPIPFPSSTDSVHPHPGPTSSRDSHPPWTILPTPALPFHPRPLCGPTPPLPGARCG